MIDIDVKTAQDKYCPDCGAKNPVKNNFCNGCGHRLPDITAFTKPEVEKGPSYEGLFSAFPYWSCGGKIDRLAEYPERNSLELFISGAEDDSFERYKALLTESGFSSEMNYDIEVFRKTTDELLYWISFETMPIDDQASILHLTYNIESV